MSFHDGPSHWNSRFGKVRPQKLPHLDAVGPGKPFHCGQPQLSFSTGLDRLIIFVRNLRQLRELLLRQAVGGAKLPEPDQQSLERRALHRSSIQISRWPLHPTSGSVSVESKGTPHSPQILEPDIYASPPSEELSRWSGKHGPGERKRNEFAQVGLLA